mmetsp:Transcript_97938/g.169632  ORF Transcript_97938/g.169632 Transcript_97938/m.169632 type:complete len:85 (-) Transcript_97938:1440-1694(-)
MVYPDRLNATAQVSHRYLIVLGKAKSALMVVPALQAEAAVATSADTFLLRCTPQVWVWGALQMKLCWCPGVLLTETLKERSRRG